MAKRKRDNTVESKGVVQRSTKRYRITQNNGKGPLRFYKWLVTTESGLNGEDVAAWKMENSGQWGVTWQNGLPALYPRMNDPEEEFRMFNRRRQDGMDYYFRVKVDAHQLDYIEKKGRRVKDTIRQATGVHQESLLSLIIDYSAPSLVWIRYHLLRYPRHIGNVERSASVDAARRRCYALLENGFIAKGRPPFVFEMVLNPRTLVVGGPMPRSPPKRNKY
jgi:hypothetical protein